jgi:hypothetical protein
MKNYKLTLKDITGSKIAEIKEDKIKDIEIKFKSIIKKLK